MKTAKIILVILFSSLIFFSCKGDNPLPPGEQSRTTLILEDISCTEAWIKLSTANISLPADVDLYRDDSLAETISLSNTDTLLYVDSLLPNQTYDFHTVIHSFNHTAQVTSNQLPATTMETTSHNFTWQTWKFGGQAGSCELYDIAIIDESNIWAVGEIYLLDSTGVPDPKAYNAVYWDGDTWRPKRVYFPTVCHSTHRTSYPAKSIFVFNDGQIWISSTGNKIAILQDSIQVNEFCLPSQIDMSIMKIWGTSSNDLYVVGSDGTIAHYLYGNWSRIESGLDANINDIWGAINGDKIYCAVPSGYEASKRRILTINETNDIDSLHWIGKIVTSTWTNNGSIIYTSGDGIYNNKTGDWKCETSIPLYYTNRIRGVNLNDIFVCGNYGFLAHFNGVGWKLYSDLIQQNLTLLTSISIKNGIVAAVGFSGEAALIILGKRN